MRQISPVRWPITGWSVTCYTRMIQVVGVRVSSFRVVVVAGESRILCGTAIAAAVVETSELGTGVGSIVDGIFSTSPPGNGTNSRSRPPVFNVHVIVCTTRTSLRFPVGIDGLISLIEFLVLSHGLGTLFGRGWARRGMPEDAFPF